jgi:hypothetical protein
LTSSAQPTLKQWDVAQSVVTQILTIAAAITTITLTFFKDFAPKAGDPAKICMAVSWGLYALSIPFAIMTLMAMAGTLEREPTAGIYSGNIRWVARAQILLFLFGIAATVVAGALAL